MTDIDVQNEVDGGFQSYRQRSSKIAQERHQRRVAFSDQTIPALEIFARRAEDLLQHAALFVFEERFQRVAGFAEMAVD